jgi:hypothetical protein
MPYVQHFPEHFAVVRTQAMRGPCLQVLRSSERHRYHIITNDTNRQRFVGLRLERISRHQVDRTIYTLRYKTDDYAQVNEVKFWVLPFVLSDGRWDDPIPLVEFQYRSWIPGNYDPIPISGIPYSDLAYTMERLQEERLHEIRATEDSQSRAYSDIYTADPPFRNPLMNSGPDDYDDRWSSRRNSLIGPGSMIPERPITPPIREPEVRVVERLVERVVTQVRIQPLPKAIGDVLLANARAGSDSCPILSIPFKECEKLSISSCFHIFDKESLNRWHATNTNCPVCRSKIENIVSE